MSVRQTNPERSELWLWIEAVLERLPAVLPSASAFAFWSMAAADDALPTPPTPSTPHTHKHAAAAGEATPDSIAALQCESFKSALSALDIDMPESIQRSITKSMTRSLSRKLSMSTNTATARSRKASVAPSEALAEMVKRAVTTVGSTQQPQMGSSRSPQAAFKRSITTISTGIENVIEDLVHEDVCEGGEGEGDAAQETAAVHMGGCPMLMMMGDTGGVGGVRESCPVAGGKKGASVGGVAVRKGCPFRNSGRGSK